MYPEYAIINEKKVKINTDFKVALRCFEVLNDDTIGEHERALAIVYLLFNVIPPYDELNEYTRQSIKFLQCGEEPKENAQEEYSKRDIDMVLDMQYIRPSFMANYHIDLNKTDLHFWQFCELISGLTENSLLNRVRSIRTANINEYKGEAKDKMLKAKQQVALPNVMSDEDKVVWDEWESLFED
ncbi:Gp15 family bacteriophage protein [Eubacterium sp.]